MPSKQVEQHLFVVFGATGDLMRRKLLPAIYYLTSEGLLNNSCQILGVSHQSTLGDEGFRNWACEALATAGLPSGELGNWCQKRLYYQPIVKTEAADFQILAERIRKIESENKLTGNRIFYMALPPTEFPGTIATLGEVGLNRSTGWTRLVIEKPFGRDLASAEQLNGLVHQHFEEAQIYRIDHYLGKETVQNLLAFRFGNSIFESIWNRDRVECVKITVAEELGVEHRAAYYEQAGALRDMLQNHLTQLLTLTAMEAPGALSADAIRYEKVKVLRSIPQIRSTDVVLGQYSEGEIDGKPVPGYLQEHGVSANSTTDTFVAIRVEIDNWRWQGVPFFLCTGKRLPKRMSQIEVTFRHPPVSIFHPFETGDPHPNVLNMMLQPDEGFELSFQVKAPGQPITLQTQRMHFQYDEAFGPLPDAYRTLLLDVMVGDQTLFVHSDEVQASWKLYDPLLKPEHPRYPYPAGTWGPTQAIDLMKGTNGSWRNVRNGK